MQFETLKKNNLKKYLIGVSVFIVIILAIIFAKSFAKYKVVNSAKLAEGTVNYTLPDFQIVEMYTTDGSTDTPISEMPESGYTIDSTRSFCYLKDRNTKEEGITLKTNEAGEHVIGKFQRGSKCILYFNKELGPADKTLNNLHLASQGPIGDITTTACGSCSDSKSGLFETEDDDGKSYVYRGTVNNNWVSFAGKLWRIIRINGDGTIRLIYGGDDSSSIGSKNNGKNALDNKQFNAQYNDNSHVGLTNNGATTTTSYDTAHNGSSPSTILNELNTWYSTNLKMYEDKIDTDAGFCSDRTISSTNDKWYSSEDNLRENRGFGNKVTAYGAFHRFVQTTGSWKTDGTKLEPTLKCENKNRDLYTKVGSEQGNGKLTNPIGLITADEVVFAGGYPGQANDGYWLNTGQYYWTMSPRSATDGAGVFAVPNNGLLGWYYVSDSRGVRPVINLKANTTFEGTDGLHGTYQNPYVVSN